MAREDGGRAAAVEFHRVTKRYGDVVAVNAVSFTIERATLVTLLGPSSSTCCTGRCAGAGEGGLRPESLRLSTAPPAGPALEGRIVKAAYLGTHMEYTVSTPVTELFVVDRMVTRPVPAGTPVWVALEDHGVTVVP